MVFAVGSSKRKPATKPKASAPTKSGAKRLSFKGLAPSTYPQPIRWKLDVDYLDQLSQEERAWLSRFLDQHYGNNFRDATLDEWPVLKRREAYGHQHAARRDAYGDTRVDFIEESRGGYAPTDDTNRDWSESPSYLDSPQYKTALADFRTASKDKSSPEYAAALRRVRQFTDGTED